MREVMQVDVGGPEVAEQLLPLIHLSMTVCVSQSPKSCPGEAELNPRRLGNWDPVLNLLGTTKV